MALAGLATYWLARRWVRPRWGGAAGLAFAAAPWVLHQLRVGHLNLMNAGWMALALLLLLRATDTNRWRDRLLGGVMLAAALVDWQYVVFLLAAGAIVAVERLVTAGTRAKARSRLTTLVVVAGLVGVALAPIAAAALCQGTALPAEGFRQVPA